jgi:hypothetical protein
VSSKFRKDAGFGSVSGSLFCQCQRKEQSDALVRREDASKPHERLGCAWKGVTLLLPKSNNN